MGISDLVIRGHNGPDLLSHVKAMLRMKLKWLIIGSVLVLFVLFAPELSAQCPMCKLSAESNLRDGGTAGKGLNTGILYMFALPYLLVLTLGLVWYRNRKDYDQE